MGLVTAIPMARASASIDDAVDVSSFVLETVAGIVPSARVTRALWCLVLPLVGCRLEVPEAKDYGEEQMGSTTFDATDSASTGPVHVDSSEGLATEGATGTSEGVITGSTTAEISTTDTGTTDFGTTDTGTTDTGTTDTGTTDTGTTDTGQECGDGIVEGTEQCDGSELGGASCESEGFDAGVLGCQPDCTAYDVSGCMVIPPCGNAVPDPGEQCDDGGESAACDVDCTLVVCGDLLVNETAGEACDGMDLAGASCESEGFSGGVLGCAGCELDTAGCFVCGDGVLDPGELCDGGNLGGATCVGLGFDGGVLACDAGCDYDDSGCHSCGNGELEGSEQCDDGGESATCDVDCTVASCGDGTFNATAGEDCDDGGASPLCDVDCTPWLCGDGVLNEPAGEACDDGNGVDNDACSNACELNACGFDVTLLPLFVHPDNFYGEIDFDGNCNLIVAGSFNQSLYGISPAGVVSVIASFPGISSINGVAYRASDDTVYVTTDGPQQLWSVSSAGDVALVMDLTTTINAIEVAPAGFGPYADRIVGVGTDGSVHAFDPAAGSSVVVGSPGGILSSLVFDPTSALLYIAAYDLNAVLMMDPLGAYSDVVSGYSGVDGLAISPSGMLFVADSDTQAVTVIDLASGIESALVSPILDGGYYVTGMLYEAGGNLLMKVEGASIDYVIP